MLSPITEATDRREKWIEYQKLSSLQEYVLVSQTEMKIEVYRRDPLGKWTIATITGGELKFNSIDLTIPMSIVYEDVVS